MDWLATAILGAIVLYLFYYLLTYNDNYWEKKGFPHLKSSMISAIPVILQNKKNCTEYFKDIYNYFRIQGEKYGGYMQLQKPSLMIIDPEMVTDILIKDFANFHDRGFDINEKINPLSANVSALVGNSWRIMRYKLTPTFTSGKLRQMFDSINRCSEDLVKFIGEVGDEHDARSLVHRFNLNVIGDVTFGLNLNAFEYEKPETNPFFYYSTKFFNPTFRQMMKFAAYMNYPRLAAFFRLRIISEEVDRFFRGIVSDAITSRKKANEKRNDFLQLLLDLQEEEKRNGFAHLIEEKGKSLLAKEGLLEAEDEHLFDQLQEAPVPTKPVFTEESIAANSFMFISAGSETVSSGLSFILFELAANVDVQKKVQMEIDSVLNDHKFDYGAVKKMTYLEQTINEVFRKNPPSGVLMRIATRDCNLPGTDRIIEKGTILTIPINALQMDPEYFPDPDKFDPDRFEDMSSIPKGVYLPFGAGPRMCIAMRFAMVEMKVVTAKLLSKFNIILSEKTQLPIKLVPSSVSQHVVGGIWVKFVARTT